MSQPRARPVSLYASWKWLSRREEATTISSSNSNTTNAISEGTMGAKDRDKPFEGKVPLYQSRLGPPSRLPRLVSRTSTAPSSPSPSLPPVVISPGGWMRYGSSSKTPRARLAAIPDTSPADPKVLAKNHINRSLAETTTPRARPSPFAVSSSATANTDNKMKERRFVSTPSTLPSHKKENLVPRGLMRPISPTQAQAKALGQGQQVESPQPLPLQALPSQPLRHRQSSHLRQPPQARPTLTKSRTVNALSNLRHSFGRSKSTLNLIPRQASYSSSTPSRVSPVPLEDTSEFNAENPGIYMFGSHPTGEWLGRYTAIESRFHSDSFQLAVEDGPEFQEYISKVQASSGKEYPELRKPRSERRSDYSYCRDTANASNNYLGETPPEQTERRKFMADDDKLIAKRAMDYLSTLCKDDAAKKSFLQFQTTYAKLKRMPELLPETSRMEKLLGKVGTKIDAFKNKKSVSSEQGD